MDFVRSKTTCQEAKALLKELDCFDKRLKCSNIYKSFSYTTLVFDALSANMFMNELHDKGVRFLFFSEQWYIDKLNAQGDVKYQYYLLPRLLRRDFYLAKSECGNVWVSNFIKKYVRKRPELRNASAIMNEKYSDIANGYSEWAVYQVADFLEKMLKKLNPKEVIIWVEFVPYHLVEAYVCRKLGIKVYYMEYGSLPGTIAIDRIGQMGESYIANHSEEFSALPVDDEDINNAYEIWDFLYKSKLNRKRQTPIKCVEEVEILKRCGRPVVFYAGQNDLESKLYPYTEETRHFHSPTFTSSLDALNYLSELAEKNDWKLIYKPHPYFKSREEGLPSNIIYIDEGDINELIDIADVVVTILSQAGYVSLLRKKATVMLGYIQLRGKGCCYEAFSKNDVESEITKAIEQGFTDGQREKFAIHIAQLTKYYLFDDCIDRPVRYGRSISEIASKGFDVIKM